MKTTQHTLRRCVPAAVALYLSLLTTAWAAGGSEAHKRAEWIEPTEHAFQVDLPQGWNVNGGIVHNGDTNYRQWLRLSRGQDLQVLEIGDERTPPFLAPSPSLEKAGLHEGESFKANGGTSVYVLHYMPALEFNRWYGNQRLSKLVQDLTPGKERELTALSRQLTTAMKPYQPASLPVEISVGATDFTGKTNDGERISGVVITIILHNGSKKAGNETWIARPIVCGCAVNDHTHATKTAMAEALSHILLSWQDDAEWQQTFNDKQTTASDNPTAIQANKIAAQRGSLVGTYWHDASLRKESARQFAKCIVESADQP